MDADKINQLVALLEGISLKEWKMLKENIDREFNAQTSSMVFKKRDSFKRELEIEFTQ